MGRMLELIRARKAPESIVRRAAHGELALPAAEAIEILAVLADDKELGEEAGQTLRGWDEASMIKVASNPQTAPEVLRCLLWSQAGRPAVVAELLENSALPMQELESAASEAGPEMLEAMLRSERVRSSARMLELLHPSTPTAGALGIPLLGQNPAPTPTEAEPVAVAAEAELGEAESNSQAAQAHHSDFHPHHPAELPDEEERPFELVSNSESEADPLAELLQRAKHGEPAAKPEEKEQLSLLQKIVHMLVGERIKLAMRGGREERMVLIRDRSKLVSLAVLSSPKVDATEMETYAAMKNVQESVLRAIATNRKNLKNYGVIRALVSNPKAPLDVSLPLMAHLLIKDLRLLAMNKNVNETIRKRAVRMFREKTEKKKD